MEEEKKIKLRISFLGNTYRLNISGDKFLVEEVAKKFASYSGLLEQLDRQMIKEMAARFAAKELAKQSNEINAKGAKN